MYQSPNSFDGLASPEASPRWLRAVGGGLLAVVLVLSLAGCEDLDDAVRSASASDADDPVRVESLSDLEGLPLDAEVEMAFDFRKVNTLAEAFSARLDAEMAGRDGLYVRVDKATCVVGTPYQCTAKMSNFRMVTFTVDVASDGSTWTLISGRDGGPR